MSKYLLVSLVALGGLGVAIPSASAAPSLPSPAATSATLNIEQVNHRCDGPRRRNGYCPNPRPHYGYRYAPRDRYGYNNYPRGGPGVTLRFGGAPRYRDYGNW